MEESSQVSGHSNDGHDDESGENQSLSTEEGYENDELTSEEDVASTIQDITGLWMKIGKHKATPKPKPLSDKKKISSDELKRRYNNVISRYEDLV